MSLPCRICSSRAVDDVNSALVGGASVRVVARRFGFSRSGTDRHARKCLPRALAAYSVPQQTLGDELRGLWAEATRLKDRAEATGDLRAALVGLKQLAELLELRLRALPPPRPQKQVEICVRYEDPKVRPALTDAQLVEELANLARRTKNETMMACAARLALLLKNRVISPELDAQLSKAEAGAPQLPDGGNNADLA